jgi:hypothetical protein
MGRKGALTDYYYYYVHPPPPQTHTPAGRERSAFTEKGGGKLAVPRLLRLKPEDKLLAGSKPFKNGRFTWVTEANNQERWVVASCSKYTVIWNFKK